MSPSGIMPIPHRRLRLPDEEVHDVETGDGKLIRLTRYAAGTKGPIVLAPGYGNSILGWTMDTMPTNFPEYLAEHDYDIWLLDYRASPALEAATVDYNIDDIARYDWPAAIATVRGTTGAETVQTVPHCIGSLSFFMSMANGLEGVRSALCSNLGMHLVPLAFNRARSAARMATLMHGAGIERLSTTFDDERWSDRALETVMKRFPTREKCDSEVCHRILFLFGEVFHHDNINDETHDSMVHIFGKTRLTAFKHLMLIIRKGHVVDAEGNEAYMPHLDRLKIPITFMQGEINRMCLPIGTERTYDALREANGDELYSRHVLPGYSHMDCWLGDDAVRDVYPLALEELERFN